MRKTGSREPRASLEASAVSPFSIAVKTFSMRFGSRRNQRPPHQKIRSITTVSAMIDTIKIGHITGPPLRNLSINQLLPSKPGSAAGEAAGGALAAAVAAGLVPAAGGACAGGGDCASEIRASASEHRQVASSVFIVEAGVESDRCGFETGFLLSQTSWSRVEQNFSFFSATLASRSHL